MKDGPESFFEHTSFLQQLLSGGIILEKKVLFVASTFSHLRNFHQPYIKAFHDLGWRVDLACGGERAEISFSDRAISLPFEKKMSSLKNIQVAAILRREIRKEQYDMICSNTSLASFFARLALVGMRERPFFSNMVHGYLFDENTSPAKKTILLAAEKMTAPLTDLLFTMNRYDYELAKRYALGKKIVFVPGVGVNYALFDEQRSLFKKDIRRDLEIADDAFVLIYAAEFSERKSQMVLIDAMTTLPLHVVLILAGGGKTLDQCKTAAFELGLDKRIFFPGYVQPVGAWYQCSDAVVSSSRSEGLPFNIMEAMHLGLPIIASDVKGNSDLIRNDENGLLYPYGDARSFSDCVLRVLGSETLRNRLGEQARADAEQYALDRVFPQVWAHLSAAAKSSISIRRHERS